MATGTSGNDFFLADSGKDTIDGAGGVDTLSYANASIAVHADLTLGRTTAFPKIMPFGDSLTHGWESYDDKAGGGYRTKLWNLLADRTLAVDFVGSQTSGPSSLGDRNHEGHPGKTIDWLDQYDEGFVSKARPDVILLMAGTNDTRTDGASQMLAEMRSLIVSVTNARPEALLLVGSVPPVHDAARNAVIQSFNAQLDDLVAELGRTRKVKFVDNGNIALSDVTAPPYDSGVHLNDSGYAKLAQNWYDALVAHAVFTRDEDRLIDIENLIGSAHNDRLTGNGAANRLDGGQGADIMKGRGGNDTYVVDNAADRIIEYSGEGIDLAVSTVSYTLPSYVESLTLAGSSAIDGTGNGSANTIVGNAAANALRGLAGNDRLEGGGGNDVLYGGTGKDTLVGGAGADRFDWNSASEAGKGSGRDVVLDFVRGTDKLDLSGIDAKTTASGNDAFTFVGPNAFSGAAGQLRYAKVDGTTDYTLVQGDTNGDKVADFEIQVNGLLDLQATDFVL